MDRQTNADTLRYAQRMSKCVISLGTAYLICSQLTDNTIAALLVLLEPSKPRMEAKVGHRDQQVDQLRRLERSHTGHDLVQKVLWGVTV